VLGFEAVQDDASSAGSWCVVPTAQEARDAAFYVVDVSGELIGESPKRVRRRYTNLAESSPHQVMRWNVDARPVVRDVRVDERRPRTRHITARGYEVEG